ncbi:MAG: winged helix-turn-helix domain-containing protein [Candidatus Bathyarchaeia archaeon]
MAKPRLSFKIWMETDEGYVFGPGVYSILERIEETGTLKAAAEDLDMSYRYAWGLIKRAEASLDRSLIRAHKGGRSGGGGTELTETGEQYIEEFRYFNEMIQKLSDHLFGLVSEDKFRGKIREIYRRGDKTGITVVLDRSVIDLQVPLEGLSDELDVGDEIDLLLGYHIESIERV